VYDENVEPPSYLHVIFFDGSAIVHFLSTKTFDYCSRTLFSNHESNQDK